MRLKGLCNVHLFQISSKVLAHIGVCYVNMLLRKRNQKSKCVLGTHV